MNMNKKNFFNVSFEIIWERKKLDILSKFLFLYLLTALLAENTYTYTHIIGHYNLSVRLTT